jgi:hypothetical protein
MSINDKEFPNPYPKASGAWHNFENRFKRVVDDKGKHHAYWCFCIWCDLVKTHVPSGYKVVEVDDAWDPLDHRPWGEVW